MRLEALARRFQTFGEVECLDSSPLYSRLALAIAGDDELLSLASHCAEGQPVANLLFAGVHFLLLQGEAAPLSRFYPDLCASPASPADAYPAFRDFCLSRRQQIIDIVTTRLVQTNEVRRCGYLFPAFSLIAAAARLPLALVEVGTSAGLNLLWDKYGYRYSHQGRTQAAGDSGSPVQIRTELIGDKAPALPAAMPNVSHRIGLDLNIINPQNAEEARWLRALIWPEHSERFRLLHAASGVLVSEAPTLISGDAVASLAEIIRAVPAGSVPVVFHTHVINQFSTGARGRLEDIILEASKQRAIYRVCNDLGGGMGGRFLLKMITYQGGQPVERKLAYCDGHARSLEWLAGVAGLGKNLTAPRLRDKMSYLYGASLPGLNQCSKSLHMPNYCRPGGSSLTRGRAGRAYVCRISRGTRTMSKVLAETTADEGTRNALQTRRAERAALLGRITRMLEEDDRVAAAWLFGSMGRGEADDLSDLDLRVIVSDEHIESICADRQAYTAQVGEAVLFAEAPQNRPAGGAFLLTLYAGALGPQEVDWAWQPLSGACLWPGTRLLLNRAALTRQGEMPWGYQPRPEQTALEEAEQRVANFWAMLLIIAKYAARTPDEDEMGLVGMSVQPLREVSEFLGLTPRYAMENLPAHGRPEEKVHLLRALAGQMEALMPAVEAQGGSIPWAALPHARRFLDLVEATMKGLQHEQATRLHQR